MYNNQTIGTEYRVLKFALSSSHKPLSKLISDRYAALSKTPPAGSVLQVILTPVNAVTFSDGITGDEGSIGAGVTKAFPIVNAQDRLTLKDGSSGDCVCEIFYGDK